MDWDNYFNSLSKQYRIEINQTLQNAIKEHFGENLNIYTEQDMYEQSRKIIHSHYLYRYDRYSDYYNVNYNNTSRQT